MQNLGGKQSALWTIENSEWKNSRVSMSSEVGGCNTSGDVGPLPLGGSGAMLPQKTLESGAQKCHFLHSGIKFRIKYWLSNDNSNEI